MNGFELDHYEEQEREWRSKEEAANIYIEEDILKVIKELQCVPDVAGLNYEDLCIHSNLHHPKGFKMEKINTFRGTGNPLGHLRD